MEKNKPTVKLADVNPFQLNLFDKREDINTAELREFIKNHLDLSNREISEMLHVSYKRIKRTQERMGIVRSKEQLKKIRQKMSGEKNGNYKSGVYSNSYKYKLAQRKKCPEKIYAREAVHRAVKSGN